MTHQLSLVRFSTRRKGTAQVAAGRTGSELVLLQVIKGTKREVTAEWRHRREPTSGQEEGTVGVQRRTEGAGRMGGIFRRAGSWSEAMERMWLAVMAGILTSTLGVGS